MNTVFEEKVATKDTSAIEHNAQIRERYNRLKSADEAQLNEMLEREMGNQTAAPVQDAPVIVPSIGHEIVDSPIFRTDTLEKIIENERGGQTATQIQSVSVETAEAVSYSLTNFAKMVISMVASLVMIMFTAICINSHVISANQTTIDALEQRYETLVNENAKYAELIEQARSEERIAEWANLNGWTLK